jgi:hypothetical protein
MAPVGAEGQGFDGIRRGGASRGDGRDKMTPGRLTIDQLLFTFIGNQIPECDHDGQRMADKDLGLSSHLNKGLIMAEANFHPKYNGL